MCFFNILQNIHVKLYWHIGETITQRQEAEGWGKAVVERLSSDLQKEFPGQQGFSVQNLWYMRQFYITYRQLPNLQQLAGEIPWSHNIMIMSKLKTKEINYLSNFFEEILSK